MEKSSDQLTKLDLAKDPTTDKRTLAELSGIADEAILCAVASNPNASPSTLAQLQIDPPIFFEYNDIDGSEFNTLFSCIAANPNTPAHILGNLASNYSICYELAGNPNTPISILNQLANWNNWQMWKSLISNPALPISALERLSSVESQDIRQEILNHQNVSTDAIAIIDFMEGNYSVSTHIFEKLALDNRLHVLIALAKCPRTPSSVLNAIAATKLTEIYKIIVANPNTTSKLLEKIVPELVNEYNQKNYDFRGKSEIYNALLITLSHINLTAYVIDSISYACLEASGEWRSDLYLEIAKNALTSPGVLARLVKKMHPGYQRVCTALANNSNTPAECLQLKIQEIIEKPYPNWGESNSFEVIQELLASPNLPSNFLKELFNLKKIFDETAQDFYVSKYVLDIYSTLADNPNTPPECLQLKIRELLEASHIEKNGFDRSINAVNRLLHNTSISSEILEEIFNYESGSYHYFESFVRSHPNCPPHLLDS